MTSITKTTSLGEQLGRIYRPLLRRLLLVVFVAAALAAGAVAYFDQRLVSALSEQLITVNNERLAESLEREFERAGERLDIALAQMAALDFDDAADREQMFSDLAAYLEEFERLDSINLADGEGGEFVLIQDDDAIRTRYVDARRPEIANWQRRRDDQVLEAWERRAEVSPLERDWYLGALEQGPDEHFWSEPYPFLTTGDPGMSVASMTESENGRRSVMAFNVTLSDITRFTLAHQPSRNGVSAVFTADGRVLGLPKDPRFDSEASIRAAVMQPVADLDIPVLSAALSAWESDGRSENVSSFRDEGGARWWSGFRMLRIDEDRLWLAMLIPERDFVGNIPRQRNLSLAGITGATVIALLAVVLGALRRIRQRMKAAVDRVEEKLGQYHLRQKIGQGGNGTVYLADHALLRRPTAIKLMNPAFAESEGARRRFEHEVRITSSLSHPNTIAIYDYGKTPEGTLYYAMELLNGGSLEQVVRSSGPMPAGRVLHVLEQIAGSLAEAHERGLIHRDIKPSNVILCERGGMYDVAKVLDFGLVKELASTDGNLTQENVLVGTPLYLAPETIREPGRASPASDLYALGGLAYFLLTGRTVFEGTSAVEICSRHLNDEPVPPSRRAGITVPEDLELLVLRLLAKDPDARPASARELLAALRDCADFGTWRQPDAQSWWESHSTMTASVGAERTPLSDTDMMVDLDDRLISGDAATR